jgi:hypothetical protein
VHLFLDRAVVGGCLRVGEAFIGGWQTGSITSPNTGLVYGCPHHSGGEKDRERKSSDLQFLTCVSFQRWLVIWWGELLIHRDRAPSLTYTFLGSS